MIRKGLSISSFALSFGILVGLTGCSDNPVAPHPTIGQSITDASQSDSESNIHGRVDLADGATRQLKLANDPRVILVSSSAEMVQRVNGVETAIAFGTICSGDSVEIKGDNQTDGSILASRVRVRIDGSEDDLRAEVEFKTTIIMIDYTRKTFLTAFCWQVETDSMTYIFTTDETTDLSNSGAVARRGYDEVADSSHTQLTFADLKVGDSIEVYGNYLPTFGIYAVAVKLENGSFTSHQEVEFTDIIASMNANNRTITFVGDNRTGSIDWSAGLTGLNQEPLSLEDFSAGMRVEVRGFVREDGQISIVTMHREEVM